MKIRLRYLISFGIITPLMVFAPVAIARGEDANSTTNTTTTTQSGSNSLTEQEKTELQTRLEKEKSALKIKLGALEIASIKAKCLPAQSNIKSLSTRFVTNVPQRTKAYEELSSHLDTLISKLQSNGVDTTELKQELTVLQGKITTYKTDLAAYQQDLSDAKNIDCKTSPDDFKAALQTARTDRDKVLADITDIKTYVTNTIKPTLQKIRTALEAQEQNNSSQSGESN